MFLWVIYLLVRCVLGCLMVRTRREVSNDAELLVLRHENAMLRRQTSKIRYQPGDRLWLAALSRLVPGIASPHSAAGEGRLLLVPGAARRASLAARTAPTTPGFKACMMGKSSAARRVTIPRPSRRKSSPSANDDRPAARRQPRPCLRRR